MVSLGSPSGKYKGQKVEVTVRDREGRSPPRGSGHCGKRLLGASAEACELSRGLSREGVALAHIFCCSPLPLGPYLRPLQAALRVDLHISKGLEKTLGQSSRESRL